MAWLGLSFMAGKKGFPLLYSSCTEYPLGEHRWFHGNSQTPSYLYAHSFDTYLLTLNGSFTEKKVFTISRY